jgi:hypothetical protein
LIYRKEKEQKFQINFGSGLSVENEKDNGQIVAAPTLIKSFHHP